MKPLALSTFLPSIARSLSPARRPPFCAALPASTPATESVPPPGAKPSLSMKSWSASGSLMPATSTGKSNVPSGVFAVSTTRRWSNDASSSFQRRSDHERIGCESPPLCASRIDTIVSPPSKPAWAAAVSGAGAEMIAAGSVTPPANTAENSTIARMKLAIGPAATIAMRLPTLCRLNARGRSSGGMRAVGFALVEHLHVAAERQRGDRPLDAGLLADPASRAACRSRPRSAAPSRRTIARRCNGRIRGRRQARLSRRRRQRFRSGSS